MLTWQSRPADEVTLTEGMTLIIGKRKGWIPPYPCSTTYLHFYGRIGASQLVCLTWIHYHFLKVISIPVSACKSCLCARGRYSSPPVLLHFPTSFHFTSHQVSPGTQQKAFFTLIIVSVPPEIFRSCRSSTIWLSHDLLNWWVKCRCFVASGHQGR